MAIIAKKITASLIRARRITARLIQTATSKICRYFSTFNGSSSYAALTDDIVLSGDFEIEVDVNFNNVSGVQTILGSDDGFNDYIAIVNNSFLSLRLGGGSTTQTSILAVTGKQKLSVSRLSDGVTVNYNNQVDTFTNGNSFKVNVVAANGTPTNFFDGQISDLKIWNNGDRSTGDLIFDLPISEGLKNVYDEVFYRNRVQAQAEWLLNLDGGYTVHQRLWNPDATDPSFSLEAYFDVNVGGTIVAQNVSASAAARELQVFIQTPNIRIIVGGSTHTLPATSGKGLYRLDFDSSSCTFFKDGVQVGSISAGIGAAREPNADFRIGSRNNGSGGAGYTYNGTIKDVKFWVNGTKSTGDLVLDSALDDNSNIIANAASAVNSNVWSGTVTATGESSGDINSVNVLSTAGASSQVSVEVPPTYLSGELVTNGDFSDGLNGWVSSNVSIINGVATFTGNGFIYQDLINLAGSQVLTSADAVGVTSPQISIGIDNAPDLGNGNARVQFNGSAGDTVDNVSVKQVDAINSKDALIQLTLSAGSLDNIIAGDSTTEFTGWQNIRDNNGQPTTRYQTLMNNNDNEIVLKVSGVADATFSNITARVVEGYGVLQGTRNTDYNWTNETPHAIGYNVETNEVCTNDGTNWIDAELWIDGEPYID